MTESAYSWLDFKHPDYAHLEAEWAFATAHYDGSVLSPSKIRDFLPMRATNENEAKYNVRVNTADFDPILGTGIDSQIGQLFSAEDQANYITEDESGNGIGDRSKPGTLANRLEYNADGLGNSRTSVMKQVMREALIYRYGWAMCDIKNGLPTYRVIPAIAVPSWLGNPEDPQEVLVLADVKPPKGGFFVPKKNFKRIFLHPTCVLGRRYELDLLWFIDWYSNQSQQGDSR